MKKSKAKLRAQVKSRFYYIFWGAATIAVVSGQIYVGDGYRQMSASFNRMTSMLYSLMDVI
jgi:uncharacterized membrane protein|tara:strand:- start:682 stop:864 length:183 start_codon:yes stop_codon:yes gene_type:complete